MSKELKYAMVKLFVGGFPRDLEEAELQDIFEEYGPVSSVKIIRDKHTGISRRFGFVEMASKEDADKVIEILHGGSIDDEEISVKKAVTITPPAPAPKKVSSARPFKKHNTGNHFNNKTKKENRPRIKR